MVCPGRSAARQYERTRRPSAMSSAPLSGWAAAEEVARVRRASASLYARLRSIERDARRVLHLHATLAPRLPLYGNVRAGAWYAPGAAARRCFFKSADGHYNQWRVCARRPNIPFLRDAVRAGGAVVVDATRAGKIWPDALSKTLPMWCAVVSALAAGLRPADPRLVAMLHLHPCVPASEAAAIARLLPAMLQTWEESGVDVCALAPGLADLARRRAQADASAGDDDGGGAVLRCLWTRADSEALWEDGLPSAERLGFLPILCLSASPPLPAGERAFMEADATDDAALGLVGVSPVEFPARTTGFSYVQGAGDDEEGWSRGLTPASFWANRNAVLAYCAVHQNARHGDAEFRDGLALILRQAEDDVDVARFSTPLGNVVTSGSKVEAEAVGYESAPVLRCAGLRIVASKPSSLLQDVACAVKAAPSSSPILVLSHSVTLAESDDGEKDGIGQGDLPTHSNLSWFCMSNTRGKPDYKQALRNCVADCLQVLREGIFASHAEQQSIHRNECATIICDSGDGDWATAIAVAWMALYSNCDLDGLCEYSCGSLPPARSVGKQRLKQIALRIATERADLVFSRRSSQQLNMFFMSSVYTRVA